MLTLIYLQKLKKREKSTAMSYIISSMQKQGQLHLHELLTFQFSCFSPLNLPAILRFL